MNPNPLSIQRRIRRMCGLDAINISLLRSEGSVSFESADIRVEPDSEAV
jgi:hypothetical protein